MASFTRIGIVVVTILMAGGGRLLPCSFAADRPIVIAHRGASGYLPEHTLEAVAMAYAMQADYIEQDVVLSKDGVPVVLHDIHLDTVTNVASVFPSRKRDDGRYYAIDFTVSELSQLTVVERFDRKSNKQVFAGRFPLQPTSFRVPTLAEEISMIQGLNRSTGRDVGIYVEVKAPAWHRRQGQDTSRLTLQVLSAHGYENADDNVFVQCFEADETARMRKELQTRLPLIQLMQRRDWDDAAPDFDAARAAASLKAIAAYADGIGPALSQVVREKGAGYFVTDLVAQAHAAGLEVHPYTFRADALPRYVTDFETLHQIFFVEAGIDGVFTDFPDRSVQYRKR